MDKRKVGQLTENMAAANLVKKGYQILERNFANRFGEIDIVAKDKDILVFVEVKSKIGTEFGLPEEMINPHKLQKIKNMAIIYMKGQNMSCRIDVIAILLSEEGNLTRLTHYENVYM